MAKILIVEDDAHIVAVMSLWLRQHGHETVKAANGAEALSILTGRAVDLIVTDVNMPHLDGLGFVQAVREERGLSMPILMLTASCDQLKLAERMKPYDVELRPKPFMPSRLVADIDRMLGACANQ